MRYLFLINWKWKVNSGKNEDDFSFAQSNLFLLN